MIIRFFHSRHIFQLRAEKTRFLKNKKMRTNRDIYRRTLVRKIYKPMKTALWRVCRSYSPRFPRMTCGGDGGGDPGCCGPSSKSRPWRDAEKMDKKARLNFMLKFFWPETNDVEVTRLISAINPVRRILSVRLYVHVPSVFAFIMRREILKLNFFKNIQSK